MHEVSLVVSMIDQIEEVSRQQGFDRVLEVRLRVGLLSGVDPSCLEFCYSEVTRGSILEGSKLTLLAAEGKEFNIVDIEVP